MIEDMNVRGFTEDTRRDYIRCVKRFAAFIGRSPDAATAEDVRRFQVHQTESGMRPPGINSSVSALRFFFTVTLDRPDLSRRLAIVHQPRKLLLVLSAEEVARLLEAAPGPKYKAALGTAYGTGLRISEIVALKVTDIDSTRMLIRVEQGKGRKDRHAMLSPQLLELLRAWWREGKRRGVMLPQGWLFPGTQSGHTALQPPAEPRCSCRCGGGRDQEAGDAAHVAPQLRHPSPGAGHRYPRHPGPARGRQARHHRALCPRRHQHDPHRDEPARPDQAADAGRDATGQMTPRR
jgi:site-specific recombinase XerC